MRVLAALIPVLVTSWAADCAADDPNALYRPQVRIEDDPPAFYAVTHYRERGLPKTAGGFDADEHGWVESLKTYVANKPLRPTHGRHTVYICPLGPMDSKMQPRMRILCTFLEVYLTLPVKIMQAVPIAGRRSRMAKAHGCRVRQYETGHLKDDVLKPSLPDDALGVLGLTAQDLYSEEVDWDSVASKTFTGRGFAVCSLIRFFPEPWGHAATSKSEWEGLGLSLRTVAAACCGMLGPSPCRKYYCVLNQSRYISTDKPIHLCPDCLRKLRWSLGFDLIERYEALRRFYTRTGMRKEARWVAKRIAECRAGLAPEKPPEPPPGHAGSICEPAPAPH